MNQSRIERTGAFHFQVHGPMTFEWVSNLLQQSEPLFADLPEVEINLERVEKADSAGLALMFEWMARATERDAKVLFTQVPESIHAVADLCQVESLLSGHVS
jgi:phospholipid transport system transporter-binding protein